MRPGALVVSLTFALACGAVGCGAGEAAHDVHGAAQDAGAGDDGGALVPCAAASALPSELVSPDPRWSWAGAVAIVAKPLLEGIPLQAWSVDGAPMPPPAPTRPYSVLDTRTLADDVHTLDLDIVEPDHSLHHLQTKFCVANGRASRPPFEGTFVDVTRDSGLGALAQPEMGSGAATLVAGAVAADFDGDGDVDLFAWNADGGRVFAQTAPLVFAPQGAPIARVFAAGAGDLDGDGDPDLVAAGDGLTILRNDGGALVDATAGATLPFDPAETQAFRAVAFADVDEDGLLDVALSQLDCDHGRPRFILRNEGDLHFADVAPALGLSDPMGGGYGMSLDVVGDDGILHVWRYTEGCRPGESRHQMFGPGPDLPVPLVTQSSLFAKVPPMGSAWLDADGDGALDVWLAGDVTSPLLRSPDFADSIAPFVGVDAFVDETASPVSAWSMALLDADLDGKPDVFVVHHPSDPALGDASSSRFVLFRQRGPGALRDVSSAAGLGGVQRCRAVQPVDIDRDGDTDLVVGCVDGVRLLRNDLVDPARGRTVALHGTVSNSNGVHAILTTPTGERRLSRGGGQPYAGGVVQETVFAPNGHLTVQWPSGIQQSIDVGHHPVLDVTEPKALTVTPRRIPAGSNQPVTVEVSPSSLGTPAAAVSITATAGTWSNPLTKSPDGIWRGTFIPPAKTSTVVLTVTIGSTTLRVRPRIYVR